MDLKEISSLQKPVSPEAEKAVLGACMVSTSDRASAIAAERLKPEDFYYPSHKYIFQAILNIMKISGKSYVDIVSVGDELRKLNKIETVGGSAYIGELGSNVFASANIEDWISRVKRSSILRLLISTCESIIEISYKSSITADEQLDNAEKLIFDIRQEQNKSDFAEMKDIVGDSITEIRDLMNKSSLPRGVKTHFTRLDRLSRGFQRKELIILASRPSMGKTALALNIATQVALKGNLPVIIFSLEMDKTSIVQRMLSSRARIDNNKFYNGFLKSSELEEITNVGSELSVCDIFIDDSSALSVFEIKAKARRKAYEFTKNTSKKKLGLIIIDYLQLISYSGTNKYENRQIEVANISMSLKALAKELDVPVLALSQLSRRLEDRQNRKPLLSDLRESGAIEQDADLVMFLHRDHYYNRDNDTIKNDAELIVAKNRNGQTGSVQLHWYPEILKFENITSAEM